MKKQHKNRAAYTLVEMLFVIAIIGVLAMLLIGSFNYILMRSEAVRCVNSMRQMSAALHSYRNDHDGWLPPGYPIPASVTGVSIPAGMKSAGGTLHTHLIGYLSDMRYNASTGSVSFGDLPFCPGGMGGAARRLDSDELTRRVRGSYGITNLLGQVKFDAFPLNTVNVGGKNVNGGGPPKAMFDPTRYPFLVEIRADGWHIFSWSFAHQNQALNGSFGESGSGWGQISPGRSHGLGDALNFVFMSGHIETIARNDSRSVPSMEKNWYVSAANPHGMFSNNDTATVPSSVPEREGQKVYWSHEGQIGDNTYKDLYPQFAPN